MFQMTMVWTRTHLIKKKLLDYLVVLILIVAFIESRFFDLNIIITRI